MGPLEMLFALQRMRDDQGMVPRGMALPYQDITQRPREPMRGFRDPEQVGPAPPADGPLAQMFGDQRGQLRRPR